MIRQITFSIKEEEFQKIEEECKKQRRTKSSLIRFLVLSNIKENSGEVIPAV